MQRVPAPLGIATLWLLGVMNGSAITVGYTDAGSFFAALPYPASTVTFETVPAGFIINSGSSFEGISFTYSLGGLNMEVVSDFKTTSGTNSLGLNDPGNFNQFVAGDNFDLAFSTPTRALGLYFITSADPVFPGDIIISNGVDSVTNASTPNLTLADGGTAYFVGMISSTTFTTAKIDFGSRATGAFLFNVDDITTSSPTPVPEPTAFILCGTGLVLLSLRSRQ